MRPIIKRCLFWACFRQCSVMITVTKVSAREKRTARESQTDDKREERDARMRQIDAQCLSEALCTESTLSQILFIALQQLRWQTWIFRPRAPKPTLPGQCAHRQTVGWAGLSQGMWGLSKHTNELGLAGSQEWRVCNPAQPLTSFGVQTSMPETAICSWFSVCISRPARRNQRPGHFLGWAAKPQAYRNTFLLMLPFSLFTLFSAQ